MVSVDRRPLAGQRGDQVGDKIRELALGQLLR
jgi:hypothetical protein